MKRNSIDIKYKKFRRRVKDYEEYLYMLDHRNDDVEWISVYTVYRFGEAPRVVRRYRVGYGCMGIAWEAVPRTYKTLHGGKIKHYCNIQCSNRRKKACKKSRIGGYRRSDRNLLENFKHMSIDQILDFDYSMSNYYLDPWDWD